MHFPVTSLTYWMSNLPYFPAILFFAASSLLYLGGPMKGLADSPLYFLAFTIVTLALITLMNVVGLNTGKWLNNLGAIGTLIPALILVALGLISFSRFGSATHFTAGAMMPRPGMKNLIFLSTIFFAFGGCESASFMGDEIREPRRVIPRSLFIAGIILAVGYIAGTFSLLVALPAESISGLSGFMTAIDLWHDISGCGLWSLPSPCSSLSAALARPARTFRRLRGCPLLPGYTVTCPPRSAAFIRASVLRYVALISYGAAGILFGLLGQAGASVRGAYDMLVAMGVITYFIPYLFLFASAVRMQSQPPPPASFRLPGGTRTIVALASIGFLSTACTIVLSLFPAEDDEHPALTLSKVVIMTLVLLIAGVAIYRSSLRRHQPDIAAR